MSENKKNMLRIFLGSFLMIFNDLFREGSKKKFLSMNSLAQRYLTKLKIYFCFFHRKNTKYLKKWKRGNIQGNLKREAHFFNIYIIVTTAKILF